MVRVRQHPSLRHSVCRSWQCVHDSVCVQDRSIAVWDMQSAMDITLRRVLVGHRAAVNVVDFDDKYIVSASGDRTIKIWSTATSEFIRTLNGHKRGIACLQYRDRLVVSGSSDNTIRYQSVTFGFWSLLFPKVCVPLEPWSCSPARVVLDM